MKKLLFTVVCLCAIATSCKEKTAEEKMKDGLEEFSEGVEEKSEETGKKANKLFESVKEDIEEATKD